ncbi:MAG: hypothetical protein JSR00_05175 [Bacteroidetes bacterium]|nr:hypothetical protein [Bacteroidota bacterium]
MITPTAAEGETMLAVGDNTNSGNTNSSNTNGRRTPTAANTNSGEHQQRRSGKINAWILLPTKEI